MKKILAVLLVALIIGVTPAYATENSKYSQPDDPMALKGKGIDSETVAEVSGENVEQNLATDVTAIETSGAITEPVTTVEVEDSTPAVDEQVTETMDAEAQENEIVEIDTTGIIMQSTDFNCGPAALATVLGNFEINTTEQELATLAGTDESGTTMYGLAEAAKAKGLNAVGMKLLVDDLKPNNIVFLTIDDGPHYSVVREITADKVLLADPSLGNIEMSKEKFSEVYSGNALVITDPNTSAQVNSSTQATVTDQTSQTQDITNSTDADGITDQASNQANQNGDDTNPSVHANNTDANPANVQSENSKNMTSEEMQSVRGKAIHVAIFAMWAIGNMVVSIRNKYLPRKYWKYVAYHPPTKRVKAYIGKDHCIHYVEY